MAILRISGLRMPRFSALLPVVCALVAGVVLLAAPPTISAQETDDPIDPDALLEDEPDEEPADTNDEDDDDEALPDPEDLLGDPDEDDDDAVDEEPDEVADPDDDDIDSLFRDPTIGIIEDDEDDPPVGIEIDEVTTDPEPRVRVSMRSRGGVNVGLRDWPDDTGAEDFRRKFGGNALFDMRARASVDYRPTGYQRFFIQAESSMDEDSLDFSDPEIREAFVDYTLADRYFIRAGKQGATWGETRLLENPGNFMSNLRSGIGLRVSSPLGPGEATGVIYTTSGYVSDADGNTDHRAFAYAGRFEASRGRNSFGLTGYYRHRRNPPLRTGVYAKTSLGGVDFAAELINSWEAVEAGRERDPNLLDPRNQFTANAIWDSEGDLGLQVIGEYQFDSDVPNYAGHLGGLGLRLRDVRWQPGLRWYHAFEDNSGQFIAGLSRTVVPGVRMSISVPWLYGDPGTYYGQDEADDEDGLPDDFFLSALVALTMTISY